jgi:hypothetical protein
MLDSHAADSQLGWVCVQPFLHPLQHILFLPSPHTPLFAGRAFVIDGACGFQNSRTAISLIPGQPFQ